MQALSLLACLWPGLPRLWWRGEWRALLVAACFALGLNFCLLTSFVWPEMVSRSVLVWLWVGLGVFWVLSAGSGLRGSPPSADGGPEQQDLFVQAQSEYLRGHWLEAETLLRSSIDGSDRDAEARLMLACVMRRTARSIAAAEQLQIVENMDAGQKWALEIVRERRLLDSGATQSVDDSAARPKLG